jgi:selenocysteine-specific elongation factor
MYVIGTAGHVDHGKSLLVEALTGIDPDRLREEKARGMTIDLGFAWLTLPGGRSVSIVDVPGHERFIKNMLAGAGGVDLALLVVAADDGVMPQTREHLAILDLLDVRRGIVALTKCDLADDDWLQIVASDIEETLAGTTLAGAPIVRCSAVTRTGLDDLLRALDAAIDELPPRSDVGRPRLPIDRVFTIDGFGTVVTGTLVDGAISVGDEVEVMPGGLRGRVRGLQSHRDAVDQALPGTRTAVNLTGIPKDQLHRGLVLSRPGALRPTDVVDVRLRAVAGVRAALRHNTPVTFHCHADEASAQVRLLESDELRAGDVAWAQIKFDRPAVALRGDHFVLRTPNDTVAGGVIVDAAPKRHRRRDPATLAALESMLSDRPEDLLLETVARRPFGDAAALASELALPAATVTSILDALVATGGIVTVGSSADERFVTAARWNDLARRIRDALAEHHRRYPLRTGMPLEELRARLNLDRAAFATLTGAHPDVAIANSTAALAEFTPRPAPEQQNRIDAYLAALRAGGGIAPAGGLDPDLLAYIIESGLVIDAGDGVYFEAAAYAAMVDAVRETIARDGALTLAQARDLFGTSRRHAQAALEQMDRMRITRRAGDARVLR